MSCKKDEELILLKANDRSILHEQKKICKKVEHIEKQLEKVNTLEEQLEKSNRGHIINRRIMVFFGILGLCFQIYIQIIKG